MEAKYVNILDAAIDKVLYFSFVFQNSHNDFDLKFLISDPFFTLY